MSSRSIPQHSPVPDPQAPSATRPGRLRRAGNWGIIALALATTYVCFGTSPAGTKAALGSLPPLMIMAVRGCLGGIVLTAWALGRASDWNGVLS